MILIWLIIAYIISKKPEDHQATYAANVKFVADAIVDNNTINSSNSD